MQSPPTPIRPFFCHGRKIIRVTVLTACIHLFPCTIGLAQLVINGGTITISSGAQLVCEKGLMNTSGTISNSGNLKLAGHLVNNGVLNNTPGSELKMEGSLQQAISGSTVGAWNFILNNPAGLALFGDLHISGAITFGNGIIDAGSSVITFKPASSFGTTASDGSHVKGKVRFEGIGSFVYPTGNGARYQPIRVELLSNSAGLTTGYFSADAGAAPFSTAGSVATPIVSYNKQEYWLVESAGNTNGYITLFWDGYNDSYGNILAER